MAYSPTEALAAAQRIVKAAEAWRHVAPPNRVVWDCNACPFSSVSSDDAMDHAITAAGFPHVLFGRGPGKPRWRIHSPRPGVAMCMERAG